MITLRKSSVVAVGIVSLAIAMSWVNSPRLLASVKAELFRDVDLAAQRPFQAALCLSTSTCDDPSSITVPFITSDGQPVLRLVIQYFSSSCNVQLGGRTTSVVLATTANGVRVLHYFVPVPTNSGLTQALTAQETTIYADPGSEVSFSSGVEGSSARFCFGAISGHLVQQ